MAALDEIDWVQLRSVPRPPSAPAPDPAPAQLMAGLTASHAEMLAGGNGGPAAFAVAWLRIPGEEHMRFLVGGCPRLPLLGEAAACSGGEVPVLYPPGATGARLPGGQVTGLLSGMAHWTRCLGQPDALLMPEPERRHERGDRSGRGSLDDYAAHLSGPFAWLVVAQPLSRAAVEGQRTQLADRIPLLRRKENSELDRLDLERAQARYRELTRARAAGMWNVTVLVGGTTSMEMKRAAGLLCGASQREDLPYGLLPQDVSGSLEDVWQAPVDASEDGQSPFAASGEMVAALARPPARELPGIRLVTPHRFDVTPEVATDGLVLGEVIDAAYRGAGSFRVPTSTLNRHGFICGATGSGKSQTTRSILESLSKTPVPIPWLVVESAKAEYARMAGRLGSTDKVLVIRPGALDAPPASLNPLEPEPGFELQSHADLVRALFLAAFEANEPFPQVLSRAVTECYQEAGWDLVTSEPRPTYKPKYYDDDDDVPVRRRYPTLGDLQATAQRVVENIGYGKEVAAYVRGLVDVRIGSLRQGTPGRFFEGGHPHDK